MNFLDQAIDYLSPEWSAKRAKARYVQAAYESAKPSRTRKDKPDNSNGDRLTVQAGSALRGYARNLEQNHDLAEGVLSNIVAKVIGQNGINVEPMPKDRKGELHTEFAKQLLKYWNDFKENPELSHEMEWAECEQMACRTWVRDGEVFMQYLEGSITGLNHGTKVPLSVEFIEADYLPSWNSNNDRILQSIERNGWGQAVNYYALKQHPEGVQFKYSNYDYRVIPANRMQHLKLIKRFKQSRGISIFATVMKRLEDIKDYEESERIAARVAAAMTSYIKRGSPENFEPPESGQDRTFTMSPGMVFDQLAIGEEIGTIQSNRPSGLLGDFRDAMMRAVACGTGTSYSSISKKYDGNYSAQRQELVESYAAYGVLTNAFVSAITKPTYKRVVQIGILAGVIKLPRDLDINTLFAAEYYGPKMPWIDPLKESRANQEQVSAGFKSPQQVIRDNGGNPDAVLEQNADWQAKAKDKGLFFTTFEQQPTQPINNQPA